MAPETCKTQQQQQEQQQLQVVNQIVQLALAR